MNNIITPRSTIPYLYDECTAEERKQINLNRILDTETYQEIEELKFIVELIEDCLFEPTSTTVKNILDYAKASCA